MEGYKHAKTEHIITGYVRCNINVYIPIEIIRVISIFFDNFVSFNVFDRNGQHIINNCKHILINGEAYMFINDNNKLYGYGSNEYGQLGFNSVNKNMELTQHTFFNDKDIELISTSINADHLFIVASNKLYGMGYNHSAQIDSNPKHILSPTIIKYNFKSKLKSIKCGYAHSLFLTINGNVYGCGDTTYWQLTYNDDTIHNDTNISMECIVHTRNIAAIDCCHYTSFILNNNNKLSSFGYSMDIESSINNITQEFNETKVKTFYCGECHFGCITMNNKLYMYGKNEYKQCGLMNDTYCNFKNEIYP